MRSTLGECATGCFRASGNDGGPAQPQSEGPWICDLPSDVRVGSVRGMLRLRGIGLAFRLRYAQFIKKVYEADSLLCPWCGKSLWIFAFFIDQPEAIGKILAYLGLWPSVSHVPPRSALA